jgi:hypothetical protein
METMAMTKMAMAGPGAATESLLSSRNSRCCSEFFSSRCSTMTPVPRNFERSRTST